MTKLLSQEHVRTMIKALRQSFRTLEVKRTKDIVSASIIKKGGERVQIYHALRKSYGFWLVQHDDGLFLVR